MTKLRSDKRKYKAKDLAKKFNCHIRTVQRYWSLDRAEYIATSYAQTKPWEHFGISRRTWYRRGKPMPPAAEKH